jgi:hypothetical protein
MGFVPAEPIISALEVLADERRAAAAHADEPQALNTPADEAAFARRADVIEARAAMAAQMFAECLPAEPRSVSHWGMWA